MKALALVFTVLLIFVSCKPSKVVYRSDKPEEGAVQGAEDGTGQDDLIIGQQGGDAIGDDTNPPGEGDEALLAILSMGPSLRINTSTKLTDVTASGDTDGLTYKWGTEGTPELAFDNTEVLQPSVSAPSDGSYIATLTVTNTAGKSATGKLRINWDSTGPEITMGPDLSISAPTIIGGTSVQDSDPVVTLAWSTELGSPELVFSDPAALAPIIEATAAGSYQAKLTATDSLGNSSSALLNVEWIESDGTGPAIVMPGPIYTNVAVKPEGVSVSDDQSPIALKWMKTHGPDGLSFDDPLALMPMISASEDATYILTLSAADPAGNSSIRSMLFTWDATPPVVDMGPAITISKPTQLTPTVTDSDSMLTYEWTATGPASMTFSDVQAKSPIVHAGTDGKYTLTLKVSDRAGNMTTATKEVTWKSPDSEKPIITIGSKLVISEPTQVSDIAVYDDDANLTYAWSQQDGPGTLSHK